MRILKTSESRTSAMWQLEHDNEMYVRVLNFESGSIKWSKVDGDGDWINVGEFSSILESTFSYL